MLDGRTTIDDVAEEAADVIIALAGLADAAGFDLHDAVASRWLHDVRHRKPRAHIEADR
jgi:hypothetical protein